MQGAQEAYYLRAGDTIVRRGVKEVDALFESFLDSFCSLLISQILQQTPVLHLPWCNHGSNLSDADVKQ